ncbi:MAG TPA: hypothetical protein VFW31_09885 [Candidatus Angelobacter sp.]|nr:hypothetical protein [Candidatus Angelobacter sp.]
MSVRTPDGNPVESALGVLVYDRTVAERVRTDQQCGRDYGFNIYDFMMTSLTVLVLTSRPLMVGPLILIASLLRDVSQYGIGRRMLLKCDGPPPAGASS